MKFGLIAACITIAVAGCSLSSSSVELNDGQIGYLATSRCLYMEGVLSRGQLEYRVHRDAKNDPDGFMDPILETLSSGLTEEQNERVSDAIEEIGCKDRILAWIATELPEEEGIMLTIELMEKWWQKEEGS